jgi:threonine dehydratase
MEKLGSVLRAEPKRTSEATAITPLQPSWQNNLWLKEEDQTAIGAYKLRGATFAMQQAIERGERRFIGVSTGNHALGVIKAAEILNQNRATDSSPLDVMIVVPENVSASKLAKIEVAAQQAKQTGVQVTVRKQGANFDESKHWVEAQVAKSKQVLIPPYSSAEVVAGQSTIGHELVAQIAPLLRQDKQIKEVAILAPVGGGGLLSGLALAMREEVKHNPDWQGVHLKLMGCKLEDLDSPDGGAIRVEQQAPQNLSLLKALNVSIQSVSNTDIQLGLNAFKRYMGLETEGASGAALAAALTQGEWKPTPERLVVSLISGSNP